jgi:cytochrome b subunit of formate dehydrogenase
MMWAMAALIWSGIGLSLVSPRYRIAGHLRQAIGIAAMILVAVMAWRWWSGALRADIDLAWLVSISGVFASDLVKRRASRPDATTAGEPA